MSTVSPQPQLSRVNCTPRSRRGEKQNNTFLESSPMSPILNNCGDLDNKENDNLKKVVDDLQNELALKDALIKALSAKVEPRRSSAGIPRPRKVIAKNQAILQDQHGKSVKSRVARNSTATANVLEALPEIEKSAAQKIAEKFVTAFQNPVDHLVYLQSQEFAKHFISACETVGQLLEKEPRCVAIESPCYVIGDIHGNLEVSKQLVL